MTYQASEQLADIFLKNGFIEVTEKVYPEHFKILSTEGYNAHNVKRLFTVGSKNDVKFDYVNIIPYYRSGCSGPEIKTDLTVDELKSIIAFFKLPSATRLAYKRAHRYIPELYKDYNAIKNNPESYKNKGSRYIIECFEAVKLN